MCYQHAEILDEDEVRALATKWWGNGIIPQRYFDALREAAQIGAARAARVMHDDQTEPEEEMWV
jgi:hypothetical protein